MADLSDLKDNQEFQALPADQQKIVIETLAPKTSGFSDLAPAEQAKVKLHFLQPAPGVFPAEGSVFERPVEKATRLLTQPILPLLGQIGGGTVGGLMASPTIGGVPAGILGGEALGSAAGEYLNQQFGITKPSTGQIVAQGLAPGGGRILGAPLGTAGRWLGPRLPGSAVAFQAMGSEAAEKLPNLIRPLENVDALYAKVSQLGAPNVETSFLGKAVDKLLERENQIQPGLRNTQLLNTLHGLQQMLGSAGSEFKGVELDPSRFISAGAKVTKQGELVGGTPVGQTGVPFDAFRANLKRIGDRIGATEGEERGAYKLLWKAGQQDLEAAGEQFVPLKVAAQGARREFAANDLQEQIARQTITPAGQGSAVQFNAGKVLTWLRNTEDGKALQKAVNPEEYQQIVKELEFINKFPRLGAPLGAERGSGRRLMAGTIGAAADLAMGGSPGTGALMGILGNEVASGLISRALMTETGRSALHAVLLRTGGVLDHPAMATIASALVAESASPIERVKQAAGLTGLEAGKQ